MGPDSIVNGLEHEIRSYRNIAYDYINDGRLKQVSGSAGTYQLKYDALGRTVSRTLNNTTTYYYYDGEKPIIESNAAGGVLAWNFHGMGIDDIAIRFLPGGTIYYFYQDHEGSVTHVRNQANQLVEQYRYDAFGAPPSATAPARSSELPRSATGSCSPGGNGTRPSASTNIEREPITRHLAVS